MRRLFAFLQEFSFTQKFQWIMLLSLLIYLPRECNFSSYLLFIVTFLVLNLNMFFKSLSSPWRFFKYTHQKFSPVVYLLYDLTAFLLLFFSWMETYEIHFFFGLKRSFPLIDPLEFLNQWWPF